MQEVLDNNTGDGVTEVIDNGDTLVVKFTESKRYYEIDSNGNVSEYEVIVDENPGNITVGINGETLSGTESSPYEIWCIEDLVEWSNNYSTYQTSYINLCTTLNFKSKLSYTDSTRIDYGDINENGVTEGLIDEMQSGIGFTPITKFNGTFDGQENQIKNIYICTEECGGFILESWGDCVIKNLNLSGLIESTECVGGIVESFHGEAIINCTVNCSTYANGSAGGIVGRL